MLTRMYGFYDSILFWSAEIAFRRESIVDNGILFNENIGVGTQFPAGEETLFLTDCYSQQLNIALYNQPICIFPKPSTTDREDLPMYFVRGVVWAKIFGFSGTLHQIRKNLSHPLKVKNWLKLFYYLGGNLYYLVKGKNSL